MFSFQQHVHGVKVAKVMHNLVWLSAVRVVYSILLRDLIQMTEILGKEQGFCGKPTFGRFPRGR